MQRNIKDLIPVAHALDQGYEIDTTTWNKITSAPDYTTVSAIVRDDVTKREPRKGQLTIQVLRDGTIIAYMNEETERIGFLDVSNPNEIATKAINRMIKGSGALRQ